MLTFAQRDRIRTALDRRAASAPVRSAGKLRRVSREGRLFDKFVERKRAEWDKANPGKAGAIGDGEFLKWLTDFINNGGLEKLLSFIMTIIGLFA